MGILNKFFGKKAIERSLVTLTSNNSFLQNPLSVHPDLQNLLWFADGPHKNYFSKNQEQSFEYNGFSIMFSSFSPQEPSLISTRFAIEENVNPQQVEAPSYFPSYFGLTDAQRGVYWEFLQNPYSGQFNIGYVFILYYGLERHLLEGNYEDAFRVILKLRDIYENSSFQSYSACALILTCLIRKRPDLASEFYYSLDKNHEFNFSHNLYLLCKMGLKLPLTAQDIMRMSKSFEFSNQNYIKKYPDVFLEKLSSIMQTNLDAETLDINKFVTQTEWRKLNRAAVPIFANLSICDNSVELPLMTECFKLKRTIYNLLEQAHNDTKQTLAEKRKDGTIPAAKESKPQKVIEILTFDDLQEKELLRQYKKAQANVMDRHFALISLQNFYYKYRKVDKKYLQLCIDYCREDIELLPRVQTQHIKEEQENIQKLAPFTSKKLLSQKLSTIEPFKGTIPAFQRLAIIYEKQKDYAAAIDICMQAITYYSGIQMHETASDFEKRWEKLKRQEDGSSGL